MKSFFYLAWFGCLIQVIPAHGHRRIYNVKMVNLLYSFPPMAPLPRGNGTQLFFSGVYTYNRTYTYIALLFINFKYCLLTSCYDKYDLSHTLYFPSSIDPIYFYHSF